MNISEKMCGIFLSELKRKPQVILVDSTVQIRAEKIQGHRVSTMNRT